MPCYVWRAGDGGPDFRNPGPLFWTTVPLFARTSSLPRCSACSWHTTAYYRHKYTVSLAQDKHVNAVIYLKEGCLLYRQLIIWNCELPMCNSMNRSNMDCRKKENPWQWTNFICGANSWLNGRCWSMYLSASHIHTQTCGFPAILPAPGKESVNKQCTTMSSTLRKKFAYPV